VAGTEPAAPRHRRAPRALRPDPQAIVVTLAQPVAPTAVAGLCVELRARLAELGPRDVDCDVRAITEPDLVTVDALARLTLIGRRHGVEVAVVGSTEELAELVALAGLSDVLLLVPVQSSLGGRPKSGKNVSVSRKNVMPAIPSSDTSST
jgi:hypothetical protein